jgi:hypothetical protein
VVQPAAVGTRAGDDDGHGVRCVQQGVRRDQEAGPAASLFATECLAEVSPDDPACRELTGHQVSFW